MHSPIFVKNKAKRHINKNSTFFWRTFTAWIWWGTCFGWKLNLLLQ